MIVNNNKLLYIYFSPLLETFKRFTKSPMNQHKYFIYLILTLSNCLFAQEYAAFEKPVIATVIGERTFKSEDGKKYILQSDSEIEILGRGYNKNQGRFWFQNEECSGFISFMWFDGGKDFREQDKKTASLIYQIKNAQALKEIKEEQEAELKAKQEELNLMKNECSYSINEIDVFDKVKVIRTSAKWIAEGLYIILYAKGSQKKVVFSTIDLGCTSPNKNNRSWVKVMLENDDVITFYHSGQLDCGGFELWGNLSNAEIVRLKKSPIKAIRLEGTDLFHTVTEFDWPNFFIDQLRCYDVK
tara:strand:+ start:258 stop:1157 length:900 start_codon:yes stop_codon:yes gene_type:complete